MEAHKEAMIEAEGLVKSFGVVTAVDGLTFRVNRGEIFGLVGPDGAGKTTTLRLLSGIMDPSAGAARVAGYDTRQQADEVKNSVAYMSQRFGLYQDLTVSENINFYADLYGVPRKGRQERIDSLLDFSRMRPFKKRLAGNLSGGMKQKLQLVCALIHTPKALLLDEPTNGVDPVSRREFWRILYHLLKQDVAILVTTAYLDEAERCHRVGLLHHGKLLAAGTPAEVRRLMRGGIVSIRGPQARAVYQLLRSRMGGASVNVFGDNVHVACADPSSAEKEARRLLTEAGLAFDEIRAQAPSLEDVFVSALKEREEVTARPKPDSVGIEPESGLAASIAEQELPKSADIQAPPKGGTTNTTNATNTENAVWVKDLTRRFGEFVAVNKISFEVPRGEIFGFLGPNGAGKSTTIRMLCGLLKPSGGHGNVGGFDIHRESESIKRNIGYMSQKFSLYEDLTVEENINFFGGIYGLGGRRLEARKAWAIRMAGLEDHRRSLTRILSGGWKQRLALACAILHEPPIVFLDEPTSGVDPSSRRRFWDLIYEMAAAGVTVFVTTHYMEEAEYCDRVALIYRGAMIALGTPRELKTQRMRDHILDVRCPRPQDVMDRLAAAPGVREVALFGAGLHAVVEDEEAGERAIRHEMERLGAPLDNIERITPSMEDVFVSLIEEVDRKEAA
ncbi:MAG: ATP-binding cassette domain-containing protein [Candidatus Sumerlaeota bacterium]|nr:ATP-binding cassette domain-containing protein [Candidatus Sumerlaeota bacterium]